MYGNDREYHIGDDDDDDDDLSYIETDRCSALFKSTEQMQHDKLPTSVHDGISDDSDEEKDYMALRSLVLYGNLIFLFGMSVIVLIFFFKN